MVAGSARNSAFAATYLLLASSTFLSAQEQPSPIPMAASPVICEVSMEQPSPKPPLDNIQIAKYATPEQQRIAERLREPISAKFHNTPLVDAIARIQKESGINFAFDEKEVGDEFREQVLDIELSGISLQSALKIILVKYDFGYIVSNEILSITTQEKAESKNYFRIYDVSSLEPDVFGAVFVVVDELTAFQDQTLGTAAVVGPNGFKAVSVGQDKLVIRAKLETHREIEDLLRQLVRKESKAEQANNNPLAENANYTSYLDEPSAFNELTWDLPSLNEKLPPRTEAFHPSINMPIDKHLFDLPGKYRQKHEEIVGYGYGAGVIILPEKTKATH
ncbi:hypothetical protein [Lacunimicrobium album]